MERREVKVSYSPREILKFLLAKNKGSFTSLDLREIIPHGDISIAQWILHDLKSLGILERNHEMTGINGIPYPQYFLSKADINDLPEKREATFIRYIRKEEMKWV